MAHDAPTYLLVSHDRYFLQHATNRIIEIDAAYPKGLFSISGSYAHFLSKKEDFLAGQLQHEKSLASKARREKEWLRSNPKARTTKSQARIDQAHELLETLDDVHKRNQQKKVEIDFIGSERETRKLLVAKNIGKEMGKRCLFNNLDFTLSPGTRMGLMGPNGSGKTTLLRLLANELSPDLGTIKRADTLKTVYFDQHRNQLPLDITLKNALAPRGEFISYRGHSIHVNSWCKKFLFSPDLLGMPLKALSGGERARISIAHLMLQPADLLLLDEPTNDLDIPTLEILESSLLDFPGAVVLITHDRCMLNRICNVFLALGDPSCTELFAEYSQWEAASKKIPTKQTKKKETISSRRSSFSYKEKKEYEEIEGKIEGLENEVQELNRKLEDPDLVQNTSLLSEICVSITQLQLQIEQLYLRWEELEKKNNYRI